MVEYTTANIHQRPRLQIEPTTRCVLGCPACSRTVYSKTLNTPYPKYDQNVDDLFHFLDCDKGNEIETLSLCGDHGDSIYYKDLFKMIERFRYKNIEIYTAGSHQTETFWRQLSEQVTDKDVIFFSIDGLEDTNPIYRINSDWTSIMLGLDIMVKSPARIIWDLNIFSFNEEHLKEIKQFASDRGAEFRCKKTPRHGSDQLKPNNTQYIDTSAIFQEAPKDISITPKCSEEHQISAMGYYWPCGYIQYPFTLYKSQVWKQREKWQIKDQTLDQVSQVLLEWKQQVANDPGNAEHICQMKCKTGQESIYTRDV